MPSSRLAALPLALLALLVACASKEPAPKRPTLSIAELPWSERTKEQKGDHMRDVVEPAMAELLAEMADVEKSFAKVSCKTCHGEDPKAVGFEMPSPDLPELDPTDGFKFHQENHGKILEFMKAKVTPKMAELLGVPTWSPDTPNGLGCFACHTKVK